MPTMDATNTKREESRIPLMANNNIMRNGQITPSLFPSVPALNGAASYLAETTSYLTSCFPVISDNVPSGSDGQEILSFASKEIGELMLAINGPGGGLPTVSGTNAPPVRDEITRNSEQDHSQNDVALVQSDPTRQSGISIFQGLVERVRKTVHGSSGDIGWLQHAPDMPPVEDGTERFNNILDNIRHGIHVLPNSMVYLFVPGLFSNHATLFYYNKGNFLKNGIDMSHCKDP